MRKLVERPITNEVTYIEAAGASSEAKPVAGVCGGSLFMETDTGTLYVFDEASGDWTQIGG